MLQLFFSSFLRDSSHIISFKLNVGGLLSPGGISFIGNSVEQTPGRVISVPRGLLHELLANAARRAGDLKPVLCWGFFCLYFPFRR